MSCLAICPATLKNPSTGVGIVTIQQSNKSQKNMAFRRNSKAKTIEMLPSVRKIDSYPAVLSATPNLKPMKHTNMSSYPQIK